jgi:U4/U6.U5 tri-snRNP-associated protein 3
VREERNEKNLLQGTANEEEDMMKLMGMGGFGSTQNKPVKTNKGKETTGKNIPIERKYRQYMNRKGGFNRPLDFIT